MTKNFVQPGVVKTGTRFMQKSMLKRHEDMSYFGKGSTLGHINLVLKVSFQTKELLLTTSFLLSA